MQISVSLFKGLIDFFIELYRAVYGFEDCQLSSSVFLKTMVLSATLPTYIKTGEHPMLEELGIDISNDDPIHDVTVFGSIVIEQNEDESTFMAGGIVFDCPLSFEELDREIRTQYLCQ